MKKAHDDDKVRARVVEYFNDELSDEERTAIEEHLASHPDTEAFYERTRTLLAAGRDHDVMAEAERWVDARGDAVLAKLVDDLASDEQRSGVRLSERALSRDAGVRGRSTHRASRRWQWGGVVALAAAALLVVLANRPTPESPSRSNAEAFASLIEASTGEPSLKLFASADARFAIDGDHPIVVKLEHGLLLGEFVPRDGQTLRVVSPDKEIDIVGTVFYVRTRDAKTKVGVAHGEVRVATKTGESRALPAGAVVDDRLQIGPMGDAVKRAVERYVDLDAHSEKLRVNEESRIHESVGASPSAEASAEVPTATPRPTARATIANRAYAAYARRKYDRAAQLFEQALATPEGRRDRYLLLDAARLYLNELNRPTAAVPHLRRFLKRWPDDRQAPLVHQRLCTVLGPSAKPQDGCLPEAP